MSEIIQIILFRLRDSGARDELLELSQEMKICLADQEGFVTYELYEGKDGWANRIVWRNLEDSKNGNEIFLKTDIYQALQKLIDSDFRGFVGEEINL